MFSQLFSPSSVNKPLFSCLFYPLERAPWGQKLSFGCFCNSECGTASGILNAFSTHMRDENMHPHNHRFVYFNNIVTENIHSKFKTPKELIICPARSHWKNNNHNSSDFLIAGQLLSLGGFCLPGSLCRNWLRNIKNALTLSVDLCAPKWPFEYVRQLESGWKSLASKNAWPLDYSKVARLGALLWLRVSDAHPILGNARVCESHSFNHTNKFQFVIFNDKQKQIKFLTF